MIPIYGFFKGFSYPYTSYRFILPVQPLGTMTARAVSKATVRVMIRLQCRSLAWYHACFNARIINTLINA